MIIIAGTIVVVIVVPKVVIVARVITKGIARVII